MRGQRFLRALVTLLLVVALLGQGTLVLAGTTGSISGTVLNSSSKAPVPNAKVTAASPSQVLSATTDAKGRFTLLSLAPDTYTITIDKPGFAPTSNAGVTVLADQNQVLVLQAAPQLQTIGRVASRSAVIVARMPPVS